MTIRSLAEVRARLEEAVTGLPGDPADSADTFDRYEQVAIQILDSEFGDFSPGLLEEYLQTYLYLMQLEFGLVPFPVPGRSDPESCPPLGGPGLPSILINAHIYVPQITQHLTFTGASP